MSAQTRYQSCRRQLAPLRQPRRKQLAVRRAVRRLPRRGAHHRAHRGVGSSGLHACHRRHADGRRALRGPTHQRVPTAPKSLLLAAYSSQPDLHRVEPQLALTVAATACLLAACAVALVILVTAAIAAQLPQSSAPLPSRDRSSTSRRPLRHPPYHPRQHWHGLTVNGAAGAVVNASARWLQVAALCTHPLAWPLTPFAPLPSTFNATTPVQYTTRSHLHICLR
eukprot:1401313-Pleurochrysis_carterae.AAC.1